MEVLSPSKILEDDVARTVKAQRRNMQRAVVLEGVARLENHSALPISEGVTVRVTSIFTVEVTFAQAVLLSLIH